MAILAQQQAATFPIWDGELELWQPAEATSYWPPTEYTSRFTIPSETCPWTDDMVQELWTEMLQENDARISPVMSELSELEEFHDLIDSLSPDITGNSYFTEWDQSTGRVAFICDQRGIARKFTPEMLIQRDNLNELFNFGRIKTHLTSNPGYDDPEPGYYDVEALPYPHWGPTLLMDGKNFSIVSCEIEPIECDLELLSVGDGHGIAKCEYGTVFVPKSSLKHLGNLREMNYEGSVGVGQQFKSWISFVNDKYPWRIEPTTGVTQVY